MLNLTKELLADLDGHEMAILRDRISEADDGDFIPADQVEEWVSSWFTTGELPPPEPDGTPTQSMA